MGRIEVQDSGGIVEHVAKYSGAVLGILAGLEVAGAAESFLGKVLTVVLGGVAGAWVGIKVGQAA